MSWKTAYRSFYYANAEEPADIVLDPATTALLVIDVQDVYLAPKEKPEETARWQPFYDRMRQTVIPNISRLIADCRGRGVEVVYARIACHKRDGRDRSLSQKKPGFNYLLLLQPDNRVAQLKVETGRRVGDRVEITTALPADARVVVQGAGFLNDGDLVRVVDAPAKPAVEAAK